MARILLVDDEQIILDTLGILLKSQHHQVVSIREGSEAFDLLWSSEVFDVLITDIRMSPVDGMQLIKVAQEFRKQMPILVVSAYLDAKTIQQVMRMGVTAYIKKPFTSEEFLEVLKKVLAKKKPEEKPEEDSAESAPDKES